VNAPDEPRTIGYSQAEHEQNWAELTAVATQITTGIAEETAVSPQRPTSLPDTLWPKTDDWSHCAFCAYQACCGRQGAATGQTALAVADDADPTESAVWELEPDSP
jgi:hypothetical protein